MRRLRLLVVAGTRPEAIKVAPVVLAARQSAAVDVELVATGQHTDILDLALAPFGIEPDHRIASSVRPGGSQAALMGHLLPELERVMAVVAPDVVMVQGDTASALAGALSGFWIQAPVVHLEAGLRSFDLANPFPEEAYRRLIAGVTTLHLAPTPAAAGHLRLEGVADDQIVCVGNTVVDAAHHAAALGAAGVDVDGRRLVLLTVHRRESWGERLRGLAQAVRTVVDTVEDVCVVAPVHPNPLVREPLEEILGGHDRVRLVAPLDHPQLIALVRDAALVLTDSGGIQEEAPAFGAPVLVLRSTTERPEAIEAGCAELVGTDPATVAGRAIALLTDETARRAMGQVANPFGDGRSGSRAVEAVCWLMGAGPRPADWEPARSAHLVAAADGGGAVWR